ncbi:unnamed protein product [Symbiodinium necroappetens]|uniref:Uncharacterized protein n=1 Tax=Symbiodinium necroappetens TaxID=1628268 RepID=A0A812QM96_9DINO|nr:unnamed protein product [Symbiodinium necroappetens]
MCCLRFVSGYTWNGKPHPSLATASRRNPRHTGYAKPYVNWQERGRTGLTSKATGNPFAFAERPYGTVAALEAMVPTATRPFYITDRLEVSSPGPYLSSFEESSAHCTLCPVRPSRQASPIARNDEAEDDSDDSPTGHTPVPPATGGGGVHVYFPPYVATPALHHVAAYGKLPPHLLTMEEVPGNLLQTSGLATGMDQPKTAKPLAPLRVQHHLAIWQLKVDYLRDPVHPSMLEIIPLLRKTPGVVPPANPAIAVVPLSETLTDDFPFHAVAREIMKMQQQQQQKYPLPPPGKDDWPTARPPETLGPRPKGSVREQLDSCQPGFPAAASDSKSPMQNATSTPDLQSHSAAVESPAGSAVPSSPGALIDAFLKTDDSSAKRAYMFRSAL